MAIWGSRKKSSENSAGGGRGSNQYMLQPKSGEYDPNTDINRANAIRSLGDASHKSAGNSVSNNSLKQDIYNLSDAIRDEDKSQEIESESNIRYTAPDFIGSRVVKSIHAETDEDNSAVDEDDHIRNLVSEKNSKPSQISNKIVGLKNHLAKSEDFDLDPKDHQDIQDSSDIEARIIKLSDHHSQEDMNDLSDRVNSFSNRRIASIGF